CPERDSGQSSGGSAPAFSASIWQRRGDRRRALLAVPLIALYRLDARSLLSIRQPDSICLNGSVLRRLGLPGAGRGWSSLFAAGSSRRGIASMVSVLRFQWRTESVPPS